jgi:GalNAc-alpha-(1->4)-GalNAc-alpha-(1->3)-diNAcBac-PP-undecaprenol alpha-1,4-N-acetyl-D-galactosaminyltransferase
MVSVQKKICVVGPCLTMGGMERASATVANAMADAGHQVMYLAMFRHPVFFKLRPAVQYDEPEGGYSKSLRLLYTIPRIRRVIRGFDPEVILVFNKLYAAVVMLALVNTRYPVVISERSSPLFRWRTPLRLFMRVVFFLTRPAGIIAQTSLAAGYQQRYFGKRIPIEVIPNPVRPVKLGNEIREPIILAVGRLNDPLKGFDRLIHSFSMLKNQTWKLVFAGGDEEGTSLKKLADQLGVGNRIQFLGKVEDMDAWYARAGMFVIPSRSEGFPNALCEAMAAGLPCISFDFVAGPRDIITDRENGILVKDGDVTGLAREVDALIANEHERNRLGRNALVIRDRFDEQIITRRILSFIISRIRKK